ncbi:hypothetical protein [Shewanella sp. 10N.286.52.B9]|uniref:hypothetical protein n=1 Tax=Shewanella sp. 10N.286.52.B9 TaxID=1880837 RepID=UPI000C81F982|nr:hypothetical protein [Shewanella sp. 10N.286.52.B9]PMG48064.1 hypothetical protein BCU91_02975 [Shewanella sp. 10N.286.52.B9]
MQEKLTVDDETWFGSTYFKGIKQLNSASHITLKMNSFFYPLKVRTQLVLSAGLLLMGLLPFVTPGAISMYPKFPEIPLIVAIINVCLVPGSLLLRHYLIKRQYKIETPQRCHISAATMSLPINSLINEPDGQLELSKGDIKQVEVIYNVQTNSGNSIRTVYQVNIHLVSGKVLNLDVFHYPLKNIFYLLVYFNYPVTLTQRRWTMKYQLHVVVLIFPVLAHLALTSLMVLLVSPFNL